jgi:hypothetical protein
MYQYIQQRLCRNEKRKRKKERKERKIVNYRRRTCKRVLISTPLYQVGAGTFVNYLSEMSTRIRKILLLDSRTRPMRRADNLIVIY